MRAHPRSSDGKFNFFFCQHQHDQVLVYNMCDRPKFSVVMGKTAIDLYNPKQWDDSILRILVLNVIATGEAITGSCSWPPICYIPMDHICER